MRVVVVASSPDHALRWPDAAYPWRLGGDLAGALTAAGHEAWLEVLPDPDGVGDGQHAYSRVADHATWLSERLLEHAGDGEPFVLHALDPVAGVTSAAARRGSSAPVVLRWGALPAPSGVLERRLRLAALRAADAVVAPAEALAREARAGGAHTVFVVPDGIDVAALAGPVHESETPLLVSLSGPTAADGAHLALQVLRAVPEAHLVVAGRALPGDGAALVETADRAGVADRLEWRGWMPREEALGLLSAAHVVLAPRPAGASAAAVLEAMCRARPVVAADVPGPGEVVAHRTTGLLVRAGDAAGTAAAVRSLVADPFRREACGAAGLDRVTATYDWHRVLPLLEKVYEQVPALVPSDGVADPVG